MSHGIWEGTGKIQEGFRSGTRVWEGVRGSGWGWVLEGIGGLGRGFGISEEGWGLRGGWGLGGSQRGLESGRGLGVREGVGEGSSLSKNPQHICNNPRYFFSFTHKKYSCVHLKFLLVELTLWTWNTHTVGVSAAVLITYLDRQLQRLPLDAL